MAQYISRSAVVAELEKRTDELYGLLPDASKVENGTITISEACNTGKYTALESFRKYIDTLEVKEVQEEPVSIWHDASEKPNVKEKSGIFVITSLNGEYIGSRYYNYNDINITFGNYDKWAYLNELINISNIEKIGKDWKEEPV